MGRTPDDADSDGNAIVDGDCFEQSRQRPRTWCAFSAEFARGKPCQIRGDHCGRLGGSCSTSHRAQDHDDPRLRLALEVSVPVISGRPCTADCRLLEVRLRALQTSSVRANQSPGSKIRESRAFNLMESALGSSIRSVLRHVALEAMRTIGPPCAAQRSQ